MTKRILITCTDSMMKQFLEPHVINLFNHGFEVEIACSEVLDRFKEVKDDLSGIIKIHHLSLQRSPLAVAANLKGYKELKEIIRKGNFDLVWTNEPVMGVVTRLAAMEARKNGTKVLYMVHGFHFYKGAPFINWLIYYPIEKVMASKTDCICTINKEDYSRAQKMKVDKVEYIHGVGIDTSRLNTSSEQKNLRKELRVSEDTFIVLSVGELNKNKNQHVVIKAISQLNDESIHYVLCGKGNQLESLKHLSIKLGVESRVHFLGYRKDVVDICSQADVFVMPSKRDGLGLAAIEAMYCGLPVIVSKYAGVAGIIREGENGYIINPNDYVEILNKIMLLKTDYELIQKIKKNNELVSRNYCLEKVNQEIVSLIGCI